MKVYRASGRPIKNDHIAELSSAIKENYDSLEAIMGKPKASNMIKYQELLEESTKQYDTLFPVKANWSFPNTPEKIEALCNEYGSVAFAIENDEVVLYILDQ